jgi:Hint domain-containing protein
VTVEAGGSLFVPVFLFSVDVSQTLTISGTGLGGRLELGTPNVGGIADGFSSQMTLDFANASLTAPNTGVIQIDGASLFVDPIATQTITDVAWGDEFVIKGLDFTGDTVTLDTATNDLTVKNGTATVFTMDDVHLQSGAANNFIIAGTDTIEAVCFCAGTMIACPDGERAVETLSIGDLVLTSGGRVMPVRWIGRNTVSTRFADPLRVLPILIRAGALADHLPERDLLVSPEHAVLVDDILVQAGALVNGLSIVRESNVAETFVYYHIELAEHALVLAEGTPAESFVDNIHRMAFDNWEEHEALYGDAPIVEMDYPRARSHRQVPMEIRARLLDRATMPALQREVAA